MKCILIKNTIYWEYDEQDQQGKAALNERNPHMTQQQEQMARSPGGPQTKPCGYIITKYLDFPVSR
jgi:hypothetical protein